MSFSAFQRAVSGAQGSVIMWVMCVCERERKHESKTEREQGKNTKRVYCVQMHPFSPFSLQSRKDVCSTVISVYARRANSAARKGVIIICVSFFPHIDDDECSSVQHGCVTLIRSFLPFQMVQAIQVLRFHLLELEKVRDV